MVPPTCRHINRLDGKTHELPALQGTEKLKFHLMKLGKVRECCCLSRTPTSHPPIVLEPRTQNSPPPFLRPHGLCFPSILKPYCRGMSAETGHQFHLAKGPWVPLPPGSCASCWCSPFPPAPTRKGFTSPVSSLCSDLNESLLNSQPSLDLIAVGHP